MNHIAIRLHRLAYLAKFSHRLESRFRRIDPDYRRTEVLFHSCEIGVDFVIAVGGIAAIGNL